MADTTAAPDAGSRPPSPTTDQLLELAQLRIIVDRLVNKNTTQSGGNSGRRREKDPQPWDGTQDTGKYATWKRLVLYKLRRDSPDYPTDLDRAEYVVSRLLDSAAELFSESYGADDRLDKTEVQVWASLDGMYACPDPQSAALTRLAEITPGSRGNYKVFLAEYRLLAAKAKWPDNLAVRQLGLKLPASLRSVVAEHLHDSLADVLVKLQQHVELFSATSVIPSPASVPSSSRSRSETSPRSTPSTVPSSRRTTPAAILSSSSPAPRVKKEPTAGLSGNNCRSCGQLGHWAQDCPTNPRRMFSSADVEEVPEDFEDVELVDHVNVVSSHGGEVSGEE